MLVGFCAVFWGFLQPLFWNQRISIFPTSSNCRGLSWRREVGAKELEINQGRGNKKKKLPWEMHGGNGGDQIKNKWWTKKPTSEAKWCTWWKWKLQQIYLVEIFEKGRKIKALKRWKKRNTPINVLQIKGKGRAVVSAAGQDRGGQTVNHVLCVSACKGMYMLTSKLPLNNVGGKF